MKLCEMNAEVVVVAYQSLKRSHSVCAQGGINAAIDAKNEGDSPENHFYDTIKGGDFPGPPATSPRHVFSSASDHSSARSHGRGVQIARKKAG